ncbi:MAG: PP2C family protein-serine/threonine phosphatase, partial [Candidatus Zixiibacteriota bacterium]
VQESILPPNINGIDGVDIGAVYSPAREVGGDFYNIFNLDRSQFIVVIGDVSNKGVPAALVMSAASGMISSLLADDPHLSVSELAGRLNNLLVRDIIRDREMFVTLFFGKFNLDERFLTYCNAGHLPGIYWDAARSEKLELAKGGAIVGQFADLSFAEGRQPLGSGDRLVLFTDGLTEAVDSHNNLFGRKRVESLVAGGASLQSQEFCQMVKDHIDEYARGAPEESHDDFTLVQVKVR